MGFVVPQGLPALSYRGPEGLRDKGPVALWGQNVPGGTSRFVTAPNRAVYRPKGLVEGPEALWSIFLWGPKGPKIEGGDGT